MENEYRRINNILVEKNNIIGSLYWTLSSQKTFPELIRESFVKKEWQFFDSLFLKTIEQDVIKPVNPYANIFYPMPDIEIFSDHITLTQKTHAEIWVEPKNSNLYILDKCMQRQFYPSSSNFIIDKNIEFDARLRFYLPWYIDENIECEVINLSPVFNIKSNSIVFKKNLNINEDCLWINFAVYKNNPFMIDDSYGIIKKDTAIYSIKIYGDVAKRLIDKYEK
jgi:hypothetical protein